MRRATWGITWDTVGTVSVTGTGSAWTNGGNVYAGYYGSGAVMVQTGGRVTAASSYLGSQSASTGTATVTGIGSRWTNTDTFAVGGNGNGTLTISAGGYVSSRKVMWTALTAESARPRLRAPARNGPMASSSTLAALAAAT